MSTTNEIDKMDIATFVEIGMLQEINRLILHPVGMAMSVEIDDEGQCKLGDILITEDPAGIHFSNESALSDKFKQKCDNLDSLRDKAKEARIRELGYFVQTRFNTK